MTEWNVININNSLSQQIYVQQEAFVVLYQRQCQA